MVQQLLLFVRATRTTDWDLHLSAIRSMLPWFFAYDRVNYARYLPLSWLEMSCVQDTHPGNAYIKGACMINYNATCAFVYVFQSLSSIVAAFSRPREWLPLAHNVTETYALHCIVVDRAPLINKFASRLYLQYDPLKTELTRTSYDCEIYFHRVQTWISLLTVCTLLQV
jgi:hypothetical protein